MPEALTSQLLAGLLQKLLVAFPRTLGSKDPAMMADVYRNGLRGLSGDAVRHAVDSTIAEDQYFPKVSRIRELATGWARRNEVRTIAAVRPEAAERLCPVCGAIPRTMVITRLVRNPKAKHFDRSLIPDEKGKPQWETVESTMDYMTHDRRLHGISDRAEEDVA